VNARKNDSEATVIMIKMIHTVFLVIFIMSSAEMAVAQPVGDKNQLVPTVKADVFSFYTTRQMRVLAQSYLAVSERGDKASANDRVKGAEFRGYLFGKAEGFHPDWRNKCNANEPEQPDRYVLQCRQKIIESYKITIKKKGRIPVRMRPLYTQALLRGE
jgi:hypothetical protein